MLSAEARRFTQVTGSRKIDPFSLDRLNHKRSDVPFVQFAFEKLKTIEGNSPAIGQKGSESLPETFVAVQRQCAVAQSVKGLLTMNDRRFARGTFGVLNGCFDPLCARIGEEHHVEVIGHPFL